jgi:hypothetical protein
MAVILYLCVASADFALFKDVRSWTDSVGGTEVASQGVMRIDNDVQAVWLLSPGLLDRHVCGPRK